MQFKQYGIEREKLTGITKQDRANLNKAIRDLATKKDEELRQQAIEQEERSKGTYDRDTQTYSSEDAAAQQSYEQELSDSGADYSDYGDGSVADAYDDPMMKQGGLLKKKKPKVKKMKRGGLASRK